MMQPRVCFGVRCALCWLGCARGSPWRVRHTQHSLSAVSFVAFLCQVIVIVSGQYGCATCRYR
jgi:hypothetical protein